MIFQRSQRRVLGYAIATAVAFAAPAFGKTDDKAKPATSAAAKPEEKTKSAKPEKAAQKPKHGAKPTKKAAAANITAAKRTVPLPRSRPVHVASTVPMVPIKATLS